MTDNDIAECIDDLLEATSEGAAAFHAAAGDVRSEAARALLLDRAHRCACAATALRTLAAERGLGAGARAAAGSPARMAPDNEASVLGECERREAGVLVAYRDVLDRALPDAVRRVIAREFEQLLASVGTLCAARDRAVRQHRQVVGPPV